MKLNFRQGVYSRTPDAIQIGVIPTFVSIVVDSAESIIATVASGPTKNYLIQEVRSVNNAWGPFTGSDTQHLYWEINQLTGATTRGATTLAPVIGPMPPVSPAPGQSWWNTAELKMKVWNGAVWEHKLRVFAATLNSGAILNLLPLGSQVGITDSNPIYEAGYILTDGFGSAFRTNANEFFTTTTLVGAPDSGSLVKLEGSQFIAMANEAIPARSLVYIGAGGRIALASGSPPNHKTRAPIGIVMVPTAQNSTVQLYSGTRVISDNEWNWSSVDFGKPLYCGPFGELTFTRPSVDSVVRVGTVLNSKSILLKFDWETILPEQAAQAIKVLTFDAPLQEVGSTIAGTISIPRASLYVDGYMHKDDMARIDAVEIGITQKADLVHGHSLSGLADVSAGTPVVNNVLVFNGTSWIAASVPTHNHGIADINLLQGELDNKASATHVHTLAASLTDVNVGTPSVNDVLTFNGTSWISAPAGGGGSSEPLNQIIFGTGSGVTSSSEFIFDVITGDLSFTPAAKAGPSSIGSVYLKAPNAASGVAGQIYFQAGNATGTSMNDNGGDVLLWAGNANSLGDPGRSGGEIHIMGGMGYGAGNAKGGNIKIEAGGSNLESNSGHIEFLTWSVPRLRIKGDGTWYVGSSEDPGTIGQVLTSNGDGAEPTWGNPSLLMTINNQAGNYTPVLSDGDGKTLIRITSAVPADVTIPAETTTNFPIGTTLLISWSGTGQVTVAGDVGVTINTPETTNIRKQHGKVTLIKVGADEWDIEGNLETL